MGMIRSGGSALDSSPYLILVLFFSFLSFRVALLLPGGWGSIITHSHGLAGRWQGSGMGRVGMGWDVGGEEGRGKGGRGWVVVHVLIPYRRLCDFHRVDAS